MLLVWSLDHGLQLVNVHIEMPKNVNKVFVGQLSNLWGGGSGPLRFSGYIGLLMVNPGRPPLPLNMFYFRPLNYLEYVKDSNQNAHVWIFKAVIKANGETKDAKIVILFSFTFKDIVSNWCNNYMGNYPYYIFTKL